MKYGLLTIFIFLSFNLFAQSKETELMFKKFLTVCNAYKQLPLQLTVEYSKTNNIALNEENTATQGVFYIQKGSAYINFGDAEQIVTDSLALMILSSANQMILSKNSTAISAQINSMLNMPLKDSTIAGFSKKYLIIQKSIDALTAVIEINSKQEVYSTQLPVEKIILTYNSQTSDPIKIETVKSSLVKKNPESTQKISAVSISIPQKGDYFIKEERTTYLYKSIQHSTTASMPVTLSNRIEKDTLGNYVPVKDYQNYNLIVN